jgi:hypothetical protein
VSRLLHQSQVSKQAAQEAIDRKLSLLNDWIEQGIPYRMDEDGHVLLDSRDRKVLEFFPTSLRQFKLWDGSQNSPRLQAELPLLTVTGNDTLSKRPASAEQAARLIAALRLCAENQQESGSATTARKLQQALKMAQHTIGLRVAELREQQRQLRQMKREHAQLRAKYEGDNAELRKNLNLTAAELSQEQQRNAKLTKLLAKVSPLRAPHGS